MKIEEGPCLTWLMNVEEELRGLGLNEEAERLLHERMCLQNKRQMVLFTGQFSGTGKSTMLNALLRQKVHTSMPAIPVITRIVSGENSNQVVITYRDGSPDEVITLQEFREVEKMDDVALANIKYVTVERRLPFDSFVFVDAPGLGNTDLDDFVATDFAPRTDAIVFVIGATHPLTSSDRAYIQKNYENWQMKNLFFVVNWFNMVQPTEQTKFKEHIRNLLEPVFWDEHGKFDEALYNKRVFFIDAYTSECYRTTGKRELVAGRRWFEEVLTEEDDLNSGIPAFEAALYEWLSESDDWSERFFVLCQFLVGGLLQKLKDCEKGADRAKKSINSILKQRLKETI